MIFLKPWSDLLPRYLILTHWVVIKECEKAPAEKSIRKCPALSRSTGMVTGYCTLFCTIQPDVKSACLSVWHTAPICLDPNPLDSKQEMAKRAQQVTRPRGTGKIQMPGHIMCTQTLRRASQHSARPSMFVYPCRSSYQCLACVESLLSKQLER